MKHPPKPTPLHKLVVDGQHPFIRRGNQTFARFDKISVECIQGESGQTYGVARFLWRTVEVGTLLVEGYKAETPVTLGGFHGELPVRDTR